MTPRGLFLVLLVLLVGLAAWGLYQRYELVTETVDQGYGPLARRDPMLAARRHLEATGLPVSTSDNLERAGELPEEGTLIVDSADNVPGLRQAARLLDWVARGGHVVVAAAEQDRDRPNPLLAPFGVVRQRVEGPSRADAGASALRELLRELERGPGTESGREVEPPAREMSELVFDGVAEPARVRFDPRFVLAASGEGEADAARVYAAGSEAGVHFAQFAWGEGLVTVMSDMRLWRNAVIGRHDHAYLLEILAGKGGAVHILQGADMPTLTELVWRNAREALFAAGVWLLAWIARRAHRFGPLREPESESRRALGEHILASSRYRWRSDGGKALLGNARSALLERARLRVPDMPAGTAREVQDALETHTGLPGEVIDQALDCNPRRDADALRQTAANLQSLWNKL